MAHEYIVNDNKLLTMKCLLQKIFNKFKIQIDEKDLETISYYLAYCNYFLFCDIYYYSSQIAFTIKNTNGEYAYLVYDYRFNSIILKEPTATTDFTSKERTDFIFTHEGKTILQTIDDFNISVLFNSKKAKKIKIDKYRRIYIPLDLEPDDLFDFKDNPNDLYKLLSIRNKAEIIKMLNSDLFKKEVI